MDLPLDRVLRPASLSEALKLLAEQPFARPLAGGTDLVVQLRDGRRHAEALVDIGRLGLDGIRESDGGLEIGACTRMDVIASHPAVRRLQPALAEAAGLVGAWPIQCRASLGGNLANASPASDTAPVMLIAGAEVIVASTAGRRRIPIEEFFRGPGQTALGPEELIVAVFLPDPVVPPGARLTERFVKVGPRREQIIAAVSLAARAVRDASRVLREVRLALGAVAPTPIRALHTEAALTGTRAEPRARVRAIEALQTDIAPIDDVRAPAWYRRVAVAVLLDRFLAEVGDG
jgi:CO/xanthine dehydrogenase FAD-binding subunit